MSSCELRESSRTIQVLEEMNFAHNIGQISLGDILETDLFRLVSPALDRGGVTNLLDRGRLACIPVERFVHFRKRPCAQLLRQRLPHKPRQYLHTALPQLRT